MSVLTSVGVQSALAALDLLADAAAGSPLLLVAEDARWLDRATCDVLAFVARRLESEPIALLIAIREGYDSPLGEESGLPELRLEGLDPAAAGALLDAHAPALAPAVRERLLEEATGNPLALAVNLVTTEHFTLQGARSQTISESTGRASMFLGAVTGVLVASAALVGLMRYQRSAWERVSTTPLFSDEVI